MDDLKQIGKYLQEAEGKTQRALKRVREPQSSIERIRDVFDPDNLMRAVIKTPKAAKRTTLELNFGKVLPSLDCCADCMCGATESYTSDALINSSIYTSVPYVADSTVVYLDGVLATKGSDYIESNPETGQITILISTSTIIISYVYTVGNCTEACIDSPFTCMPYSFLFAASTVFADTFNRAGGTPYPSGGCGVYKNTSGTALFTPVIVDGVLTSTNFRAYVGGQDNLVGASWEIIIGVEPVLNTSCGITTGNGYFSNTGFGVGVSSLGVLSVSINGGTANSTSGSPIFAWEAGTRYWVRASQNMGGYGLRIWPQDSDESGAFTLSLPVGPFQPTVNFLTIGKNAAFILDSIQVGASLDIGDWGYGGSNAESVSGYYCSAPPNDGYTRPVSFCTPESATATSPASVDLPAINSWNSYPIFTTADGLLIMIDYHERVAGWSLDGGHPSGIRVKGQLTANFSGGSGPPLSVQIKTYAYKPTLMTRNGFQGGGIIAGYNLPVTAPDLTPIDVDFIIPGGPGPFTYWGMSIVALDAYYASYPLSNFLNHLSVSWSNVTTEGLASAQCTATCECMEVV